MTDEERNRLPKMSELTIAIGTSSYEETTEIYGIEVGNQTCIRDSFLQLPFEQK